MKVGDQVVRFEMILTIVVAIERFRMETLRVYGVLEIHLSGKYTGKPREYLAGNGKRKVFCCRYWNMA